MTDGTRSTTMDDAEAPFSPELVARIRARRGRLHQTLRLTAALASDDRVARLCTGAAGKSFAKG
jgi:hypothetical protein